MIHFDGPCPFLLCVDDGPHDHPVCPECETVNYANFGCAWCKLSRPAYDEHLIALLRAKGLYR